MRRLNKKEIMEAIIETSLIAGAFFVMDAVCGTILEVIGHSIIYLASLIIICFFVPKHYLVVETEAISKTNVIYSSGGYWIKNFSDFRAFPLPFMIKVDWGTIEISAKSYVSKNEINDIVAKISEISVEHMFTERKEFQGTNLQIFMLSDEIDSVLKTYNCSLLRICSMSLKGTIPSEFKNAEKIRFKTAS